MVQVKYLFLFSGHIGDYKSGDHKNPFQVLNNSEINTVTNFSLCVHRSVNKYFL